MTLQNPVPHPPSRTRFGGLLWKVEEQVGPLNTWQRSIVRSVCLWISDRSQGRGYGKVVSRKYRRPLRKVNGRVRASLFEVGSLEVTAVSPLEPVVLE